MYKDFLTIVLVLCHLLVVVNAQTTSCDDSGSYDRCWKSSHIQIQAGNTFQFSINRDCYNSYLELYAYPGMEADIPLSTSITMEYTATTQISKSYNDFLDQFNADNNCTGGTCTFPNMIVFDDDIYKIDSSLNGFQGSLYAKIYSLSGVGGDANGWMELYCFDDTFNPSETPSYHPTNNPTNTTHNFPTMIPSFNPYAYQSSVSVSSMPKNNSTAASFFNSMISMHPTKRQIETNGTIAISVENDSYSYNYDYNYNYSHNINIDINVNISVNDGNNKYISTINNINDNKNNNDINLDLIILISIIFILLVLSICLICIAIINFILYHKKKKHSSSSLKKISKQKKQENINVDKHIHKSRISSDKKLNINSSKKQQNDDEHDEITASTIDTRNLKIPQLQLQSQIASESGFNISTSNDEKESYLVDHSIAIADHDIPNNINNDHEGLPRIGIQNLDVPNHQHPYDDNNETNSHINDNIDKNDNNDNDDNDDVIKGEDSNTDVDESHSDSELMYGNENIDSDNETGMSRVTVSTRKRTTRLRSNPITDEGSRDSNSL